MKNLSQFCAAVLLVVVCLTPSSAWALTWQHANGADANTIALYHFNETSGTVAYDSAGTRNLAHSKTNMISSTGPGWLNVPSGRYLLCDSGAYALWNTFNVTVNWTKGLTISFWMRSTDTVSHQVTPFDMSLGDGWRNMNIVGWYTGWSNPITPSIHDTSTLFDTSPGLNSKLLDGQWHHIAMTWDPSDSNARFYIDNNFITNWLASGGDGLAMGCAICVGAAVGGPAAYFAGDIDEVLIHNGVIANFSDGYGSGPTNPVLALAPNTLTFAGEETQKVYQISNAGVGTLSWTNAVTAGAAWLSVAPLTGAQGRPVTVSVDRTALAYGTHTGAVTVTANGEIPQDSVNVYVQHLPPQLAVAPLTLDFGGTSTSMPVDIWNAGVGTMGWSASPNVPWLSVTPAAGTVGAAHTNARVMVNRALLSTYAMHTGMVSFIPSYGSTQVVAAIVSTYPTTGNAAIQIHATRPGVPGWSCVRAIVKKSDGTYVTGSEWGAAGWPNITLRGISFAPDSMVTVPVGTTEITIGKGPDYFPTTVVFNAAIPNNLYLVNVALTPVLDLYGKGWRAGDAHTHYFHGEGEIMRTPTQVWRFVSAGGFDFLSMGEDAYGASALTRQQMAAAWTPFDTSECRMWNGNEEPKNLLGHYATILYDPWAVRSPPPYYLGVHEIHRQGGVGYPVHPLRFYPGRNWISSGYTNWFFYPSNNNFKEFALDVLVGNMMDGYSGCSDEASGAPIMPAYSSLLNYGYRIPMLIDSDVCFDKLNNGMRAPGCWTAYYYLGSNTLCRAALADAMRKGRVMVTTGPLVLFSIDGAQPGGSLPADGSSRTVRIEAAYPFNSWTLGASNFFGNQACRVTEIALYRNGTLLQAWTPNTPSAVVTRVINESSNNAYYMVRVLGNDTVWQVAYASPIYFENAPRTPHPRTYKALVQGRLYDGLSGAAVTGTVVCTRYGDEYWRIPTDAQGRFQARAPVDAQLTARDAAGREFKQDIMQHEPAYRFMNYSSDTNLATGNAYVPQSIKDFTDLISTMRWEFAMGSQLGGSYIRTNLASDGVLDSFSIVSAPPAFPGKVNTEVVMIILDKTQANTGDTVNYACIYRQPQGGTPVEGLTLEFYGCNPDYPSNYNPLRFIGGQSGTSGYTALGGGFYLRKGSVTIPAWVRNKTVTDGGIEVRAQVRQVVGGYAYYEQFYMTLTVGPTKRQLQVNTVWDGVPGTWGGTGIGQAVFGRDWSQFEKRYADYRTLAVSLTLNGQPFTICPTNDTVHCADADDAVFYETFYYDAQCEPQYRNIPMRDPVRTQPAWPDFSAVPVVDSDADPIPPASIAMEPYGDQRFTTNAIVQLFWHVEDDASGASNATIVLDGVPIAVGTRQNPIVISGQTPGQHQWQVIGWDNAGNVSTSAVATFVVDVPEPACLLACMALIAGLRRNRS